MKKIWKIILCAVLILLIFLGIAAKYHTWGIYAGQDTSSSTYFPYKTLPADVFQDPAFTEAARPWVYKNAFGRTVIVCVMSRPDYGKFMYDTLGGRVNSVQTVPNTFAVATHIDFVRFLSENIGSFKQILIDAGHPVGYDSYNSGSGIRRSAYLFKTLDGYTYCVKMITGTTQDSMRLLYITDPNGNKMTGSECDAFLWKVIFVYLAIAVALAGAVTSLLIFQKKRNKRLEMAQREA